MKTYQLVVRDDRESRSVAKSYHEKLTLHGWSQSEKPELVIAIGGDGTMLEAFKKYYQPEAAFVGLNMGTLGFFADWNRKQVDEMLDEILNNLDPKIVEYSLIEAEFFFHSGTRKVIALNDIVVKSKTVSTFVMDIFFNDLPFESFRGDGMIFSTPSGSPAYAHSVGGAVIHPSLPCIQMSEIASINNKRYRTLNRPVILPAHHHVDVFIKNPDKDVLISVDGSEFLGTDIEKIRFKVAEHKIKFARYKELPFFERVREKFLSPLRTYIHRKIKRRDI